jgi:hypothetical protein
MRGRGSARYRGGARREVQETAEELRRVMMEQCHQNIQKAPLHAVWQSA